MSKGWTKWLMGCGIGCGVIVILLVVVLVSVGKFFKGKVESFESAADSRVMLEQTHGKVDEFVPPADGSIAADRIERFLAVREATRDRREAMAAALELMDFDEDEVREMEDQPLMDKLRTVWDISGSAFGMIDQMGGLFDGRNQALIEQEMGMGEYTYLYVMAYYSWLENNPTDGLTRIQGRLEEAEAHGADVHIDDGALESIPANWGSSRVRRNVIRQLENQLAALDAAPDAAARADWRNRLAAEIRELQDDRQRLPWQDGLPAGLAASFEPFRDRLAASYDARTNEYELMLNKRQGTMSIRAE